MMRDYRDANGLPRVDIKRKGHYASRPGEKERTMAAFKPTDPATEYLYRADKFVKDVEKAHKRAAVSKLRFGPGKQKLPIGTTPLGNEIDRLTRAALRERDAANQRIEKMRAALATPPSSIPDDGDLLTPIGYVRMGWILAKDAVRAALEDK